MKDQDMKYTRVLGFFMLGQGIAFLSSQLQDIPNNVDGYVFVGTIFLIGGSWLLGVK